MSPSRPTMSTPLSVHVAHASVWVALAAVVYSAVIAEWWWLAAAVLAVAATFGRTVVRGGALLVAILLGAWPAAVAAGVALVASVMTAASPWTDHRRRSLDVAALADAVRALPEAERRKIEQAARGPVDSFAVVRAALADDPSRWPFSATDLDGSGFDGGPVGDFHWTVIACEAALVAGCRPDQHMPLDVHHVAGAALMLPNTAAAVRLGRVGDAVEKALGLSDGQAVELLARAVGRPGSELIRRRVEDVAGQFGRLTGKNMMTELSEDQWRRLTG